MPVDSFIFNGAASAEVLLVLAHGAGQPMDSPFLNQFCELITERCAGKLQTCRFEFAYMAARRAGGKRRPPDRQPALLRSWTETVDTLREVGWEPKRIVVGGKSLGGRMASMVADDLGVGGLLCLGYPFHPPGKPDRLRTEHLLALKTPALICQGERDPFGTRPEVTDYPLSPSIALHWAPDGNHDLRPRKASGLSHEDNLRDVIAAAASFLEAVRTDSTGHPA